MAEIVGSLGDRSDQQQGTENPTKLEVAHEGSLAGTASLVGPAENGHRRWLAAVFALGAVLELWLWWRSVWIYYDQAALYGQAIDWLESGQLGGLGKSMSGGVRGPAGVLQFLVGAPLLVWKTGRASSLVVVLFHLGGGWLLVRTLRPLMGGRFALSFLIIYWLAPWRLYLGSFVWEPSYLFLPAAVHLWTCSRMRSSAKNGDDPPQKKTATAHWQLVFASFVLGSTLAIAPQLHPSGVVLLVLTLLLWWKRSILPSVGALAAGIAAGCLPALPAIRSLLTGFVNATPSRGIDFSQLEFLPLSATSKALVYWLRLPSADIGRRLTETTFCGTAQTDFGLFGGGLPCAYLWLLIAAANVSILVCVIANYRFFRRLDPVPEPGDKARSEWLRLYVVMSLAALLLVAFVTPLRIQGWHTTVIFHAACIPVAAWLSQPLAKTRRAKLVLSLLAVFVSFVAIRLLVVVTLGFAHPMFVTPERPEMLQEMLTPDLRFLAPRVIDPRP